MPDTSATGIVLYGIGSPIVVEYEETCARLGLTIAAAVRNRPGPVYVRDGTMIVGDDELPPPIVCVPCVCPMFSPNNRRTASDEAVAAGFRFAAALVDPTATVARSATIGDGSFVNAGCIIGGAVVLDRHVVVNRGASIGHHCEIAAFASIGPGVVTCGNVHIGAGAMIGARAVVLAKVRIGAGAVVGAGSVVVHDVPPGATVVGNAARVTAPRLASR